MDDSHFWVSCLHVFSPVPKFVLIVLVPVEAEFHVAEIFLVNWRVRETIVRLCLVPHVKELYLTTRHVAVIMNVIPECAHTRKQKS